MYSGSQFRVKTAHGLTKPIYRQKGIVQGCPWSVIVFEQGIDKWLRWADSEYTRLQNPCPVQGYVDDVSLVAKSEKELVAMAKKTERFMDVACMQVKHRKCAILHGQRSGNYWYKNARTHLAQVVLQNEALPMYKRGDSYKYLGYEITIDNTSDQVDSLLSQYTDTLQKIDNSVLPTSAKIEAINVMCTSKISFYFPNLLFSEKDLMSIENSIVSLVRQWLGLNSSSTRSFFFTPRVQGGLGIINPRVMYYAKHMSFALATLNSDDISVRNTARESLNLHMTKRKAVSVNQDDETESFAGFVIEDGKILKKSKVNWPKSRWYHLFEMCKREHVNLLISHDLYVFPLTANEETSFQLSNAKAFYDCFKQKKLKEFERDFKSKISQGRVTRQTSGYTDTKLSSTCLTNHSLSDSLRSFVCRGRLQLLPCETLLSLYYPGSYTKSCKICNHPFDNVSHILNGCTKFRMMYQKRHNRIVDLIFGKIKGANNGKEVLKDTVLKPDLFDSAADTFRNKHTRPDIVVIDREQKTVMITEIAIPFDPHLQECFGSKFEKYFPLSLEINEFGFYTEITVLLIGSLGSVHNKFTSGLRKNNVNRAEAKYLAKYCSVSAAIGSFAVWKQRCKQFH